MKVTLRHSPRSAAMRIATVLGFIVFSPVPVHAQVPSPASPATNSVKPPSLAEGDRFFFASDLTTALRIYRAVQTQQDSRECQHRIAVTEDRLGQYGVAYVEYTRLVERYGASLAPNLKRAVELRLRELDDLTGTIAFESLTPSAVVRIDGRVIPSGLLARPLRVNRGVRQITVERPGYRLVTLTETVGTTMLRVTVPLEPLPATATTVSVNVSSLSAAPADVYVDGKKVGPLPQRLQLTPGEHVVYADGPTVFAEAHKINLTVSRSQELTLVLREKPAVLSVDPVATDAILWVDGKPVGAGPRPVELPSGKHTLELRRPGYRAQKLVLDAKPGQKSNLRAGPYVADGSSATPEEPPPRAQSPEPTRSPATTTPESAEPTKESQFQGIYGALIVPVMLGGDSTHSYTTQCPADAYSGACTTTAPRGGGLGLRLGYFYEWIGLELFAAGAVDVSTSELKLPPIPSISQQMQDLAGKNVFIRGGGLFGGGIRFATPIQGIRVTVGADYVYVYRKVLAVPDSFAGASLGYSVPGYFFDGGIQLGSTPGARFYLGGFLFVETAHDLVLNRDLSALGLDPTTVPAELTTMSVYRGTQYFFGPLLGIAFGH